MKRGYYLVTCENNSQTIAWFNNRTGNWLDKKKDNKIGKDGFIDNKMIESSFIIYDIAFVSKLLSFIDSELDGYSLSYYIGPIDDDGVIEVTTWRYGDNESRIHEDTKNSTYWKWCPYEHDLKMEVGEDTDRWETVVSYDWRVKYFWMMVSPYLFK